MSIQDIGLEVVKFMWVMIWGVRWYLLGGVLISVLLEFLLSSNRVSVVLRKTGAGGIVAATGLGVLTPLCSCSMVPLLAGLVRGGVPWSIVLPFMVSSPMTSPAAGVLIAGFLGIPMGVAQMAASAGIGLAMGFTIMALERMGLLADQSKVLPALAGGSGASTAGDPPADSGPAQPAAPSGDSDTCSCGCTPKPKKRRLLPQQLERFCRLFVSQGWFVLKYVILMAFIGALVKLYLPTQYLLSLFGSGRIHSVPLAAAIGLPMLVSNTQVLPILKTLGEQGMSQGAILAFLLTGPGTCLPSIGAVWTMAKTRLVAIYIGFILVGAIVASYLYDLAMAL